MNFLCFVASGHLRHGESIWFSNRDTTKEGSWEWRGKKLWVQHMTKRKAEVSTLSTRRTLWGIKGEFCPQTGKSRRKQMIWYIWRYFPCLKSAEGEPPESFSQPTTWTSRRKCSPFTLSNIPCEQVTVWALWTLFLPQKSQRNFALYQCRYSVLVLEKIQPITDLLEVLGCFCEF